MPAVLRISGAYEQLNSSLHNFPFPFEESIASQKLRERGQAQHDGEASFNLTISDADGNSVPTQVHEVLLFLTRNFDAIKQMQEFPGFEKLSIDFSWDFPTASIGQYNQFPHSLLKLCGSMAIDIRVSVYATGQH